MSRACLLILVAAAAFSWAPPAAGAGDAAGVHAAVASDRPLAGSDRGLLAYGRRLHGASEAATMPAGRGILAYGRKLHAADLMPTQGLHEEVDAEELGAGGGHRLAGSQRELLAYYGRKLQGANRELLAYGR